MTYPETRIEYVNTGGIELYGSPVSEFCSQLLECINTIPEEYRSTAKIEVTGGEDYAEITLYYERPQTELEAEQWAISQDRAKKYKLEQFLKMKEELKDEIAALEGSPENSS